MLVVGIIFCLYNLGFVVNVSCITNRLNENEVNKYLYHIPSIVIFERCYWANNNKYVTLKNTFVVSEIFDFTQQMYKKISY